MTVLSDAYVAADAGHVTLLGLLDLSAAFDTVDHWILVERLRRTFGIIGRSLDWVTSYLSGRTQYVRFNGVTSSLTPVSCGVPQGSVLGPALFVLYVADVVALIDERGLSVHAYADDLQVYDHADPTQSALLLTQMADCIARVEAWMANNRLRLNPSKSEVIWLGSPRRVLQCTTDPMTVSNAIVKPSSVVRDLGVIIDADLTLSAHVSHITSLCFFQLRQLRLIRRSLTVDTAHVLVRALIHSRLDYCNALFAGFPVGQLARLQSVLRAAARLVLGLPGRASVTEMMRNTLHWLSYPQRVTYKLCLLTYKCLQGCAPPYLSRLCVPTATLAGRSRLRSADDHQLLVPRTQTVTLGPRAFSASGPAAWNSLTPELRDPSVSLNCFKQSLKTFLFNV